jgi:protein-disulfide isomerase
MKNQKETKSNPPAKSNAPLLIIGAVLLAALLGGWYMFSSAKPAANVANKATNSTNTIAAKTPAVPANAPPGAQPPNQAGSPNATVTLEEFADFQCGSCASAHPAMNEIKSMYGSRIRFIFRNYPLQIPAHDKAYDAAVAAEAAGMQGKFWDMQNLLFTNQQAWTAAPTYKQMWKEYAQRIGLNVEKWENDMLGMAAKGRVDEDIRRGKGLNVNATPTLYINNAPVTFAEMKVDTLKKLIDAELAKTPAGGGSQSNKAAVSRDVNTATAPVE